MTIELKKVTHVIDAQAAAEETMLQEIKNGGYTLENPYVKLNPYLIAPLTALVYFQTPVETEAAVTVKGKETAGDMNFSYPKAKEHYIQVLGLYEDTANTVEISTGTGGKKILKIQTEKAPANVLKPAKIETSADYLGNLCVFLSPTSPAATAAYDYKGDVRWFSTLNHAFDLKRIKNGRVLIGTHRLLMPPYHVTGIFEMGMIGKIYNEFRVPGGYHHDEFEMEDGNILILTQDPSRGTVEDMCVLVDRRTGRIIDRWDYQTVLPQFPAGGSGSQDQHDWFHNNAVWYDKNTHSLTLSGRHQDIIINIGYDDKKLNWIIGDPEGWPEDMQKYFFKPVGDLSKFDWQYEQHACLVLPDGDIMCFDNGHWRSKVKSKYVPAKDNFSRGVRYRINKDKMEIEQIWQFGKERGADFYSPYICNVEYYGDGHYMVHSGGVGYVNGEPYDLPSVAAPKDAELRMNSVTVEIKDGRILYEMHIPANFYRAEKLSLYCPEDVLTFGKGQLLGTLGVTEEFDTTPELPAGGVTPDKYGVKLAQEKDRLVLKAVFEPGQMVMLLLEGATTHAYFVPTTKRPFLAMCVGTFLENDDRAVEMPISFEGLSGKFKISLIIDEYKYDTGCEIQI
ncbi:MAG: aryl-sulfate sulfotransferase [Gracilibacteraceae bacterium]|jgi:arylsulfate sulfotransferase|nr:aryl-sulfate sulfotransferase [Gracilibacteraceae bacterium]